ncbi:MAG TPA: hypothetical protein VMP08_01855 [Anaerolineae bacterium]|nr:hypothetical protein [Anaerolineae bacterium]
MKNDRVLNRLALVLLGLTVVVLACYLLIFLNPSFGLNPWPPIAQAQLITLMPTPTPRPTLPATWTPTPVQTYQSLATRPPDTAVPTRTPLVPRTPTKSSVLPTKSPYKFTPVRDPVLMSDKYGAACGNWGGVGGQVLDLNGAPLTGVSVVGWGGPIPEQNKRVFVSGSDARINKFYDGDGAYELYIGAPGNFDFFVVVYENGRPVSPVVKVRMVNDCTRDLALINFQRNF